MLAIRLQRTGRSGHAQFRVIVQDSRFSPKSGRVTAYLGSYDPHSKVSTLDKEKAADYLNHGAQPSDRVALLLKSEGVKLPDWVKLEQSKTKRAIRNPEKLRRNRPTGEPAPAPVAEVTETPTEQPVAAKTAEGAVAPEPQNEEPTAEVEEKSAEAPAKETPTDEKPKPEA
jgi:small subunit ribosomal protein S16